MSLAHESFQRVSRRERDGDPPERIAREVVAGEDRVGGAGRDGARDPLVGERRGGAADGGLGDVERLDHRALVAAVGVPGAGHPEDHARGGPVELDLGSLTRRSISWSEYVNATVPVKAIRAAPGGRVAPAVGEREVEGVDELGVAARGDLGRLAGRAARAAVPSPELMYWTNDSRRCQVIVADVTVARARGPGLHRRLAGAGRGRGPARGRRPARAGGRGRLRRRLPGLAARGRRACRTSRAGACVTRSRLAIAFAAAALSVAPVRGSCTPAASTSGATASLSTVVRRPPSSAVTRGLAPSSKRDEPSVTLACARAAAARRGLAAPSRRRAASGSVTRRPLRVALPVRLHGHAARLERLRGARGQRQAQRAAVAAGAAAGRAARARPGRRGLRPRASSAPGRRS